MVHFSVDQWVELAKECKYLPENDMLKLLDLVSYVFLNEQNIVQVTCPVTVCGDIHGQYYDLEELFRTGGQVPHTSYIFIGDFVDRGYYSLETLTRLLTLKLKFPNKIVLLRGNHESRQITQVYGFLDEILIKYGNSLVWHYACQIFDLLPIGALIDRKVYCVHGGLSPELKTLDAISLLNREREIPQHGPFCDLMWSDPSEQIETWFVNSRGAGWLFGQKVARNFVRDNEISLICRAHQLINEGFEYLWDETLVTVWSAPNYCYRCGNLAAILTFQTADKREAKIFNAVPDEKRKIPDRVVTPYFL